MFHTYRLLQAFDNSSNPSGPASDGEVRAAILVPGIGRLNSVVVTQTDGSQDGFTVEIYSARVAYPPNFPEQDDADVQADNPDLYLVSPPVVAASTVPRAERFDTTGMPYLNQDPTSRGARIDRLYVRIVASSPSAGKKYDIVLGIEDYD